MTARIHSSPVGPLQLVSDGEKLIGCYFANRHLVEQGFLPQGQLSDADDAVIRATRLQLDRYFACRLRHFNIPLAPQGTAFQRRVWQALQNIPFGETVSYGDIAKAIGKPKAVRAVGAANRKNPICIVIPCHRVIGATGALIGFGGGLERKEFLLSLERNCQPHEVVGLDSANPSEGPIAPSFGLA